MSMLPRPGSYEHNNSNNIEFRSPNAIPPRTSSTGVNRISLNQAPAKPVLRPLAEGSWMAASASSAPQAQQQTQRIPSNPARTTSPSAATTSMTGGYLSNMDPQGTDPNHSNAFRGDGTTWAPEKEKLVLGPYTYLYERPGKDIRKTMIAAFNIWLKVPEDRLDIINKVIGMLHTASLLIDDIEDSSILRRGIPVAHQIFGTAQTLNSANYVYFMALQELQKLKNPRFTEIYAEELIHLHRGQGMDLYWRDTLTCPTEGDYIEMVGNKTGGLFRLAVKLMMAESEVDKDFSPLVTLIGVIFQIRDDYLNLSHANYTYNKGLCEDLTEGKFSFPIIHAIRADEGNKQLLNILKQKPREDSVKKYAVDYMERMGSFAYSRKVVRELVERALGMVDELEKGGVVGEGAAVREIVERMVLEDS